MGHSSGYGHRLLRQGGGVDGNAGALVENQQILVLIEDVQRHVYRRDMRAERIVVGHVYRHKVAGADDGVYVDRRAVEQDGVGPPFEALEQGGRDVPPTAEQMLQLFAVLGRRDGGGENSHGATP